MTKKKTQSGSKQKKASSTKKGKKKAESGQEYAVLLTGDLVAFPSVMLSLYVEQDASREAIESEEAEVFLVPFMPTEDQPPKIGDLPKFGVVGTIAKSLKLADGRYKVLVQGQERAEVLRYRLDGQLVIAEVKTIPTESLPMEDEEVVQMVESLRQSLQMLVEYEQLPEELLLVLEEIDDGGVLADVVLAHYKLDVSEAQSALEELDPMVRLTLAEGVVAEELNQFLVGESIREKAQGELIKTQQEYYLKEQMKIIQRELGDDDSGSEDLSALENVLEEAKLPEHAQKEVDRQLKRLKRMHPETSEYAMLRTYLEWMGDLPWSTRTRDRLNVKSARKILDQDHYQLEKAKERILEFLSVRKLKKDSKGPILCFVGPPGVGKTSLGRSIAKCLNRKFFRMSLGGVRDEAEMRGHRRTYVGALPGRIIQGLKEAGSNNPVFLLDELDKVGSDFRGDPASALLEILDPEQNKEFRDHYLNVNFDLSSCMFIATANTVDTIPSALLDRLEVIEISSYTLEEKLEIAKRYLVPRQQKVHGLEKLKIKFQDDALHFLIESYTREAGVRNLERQVASLCRKLAFTYVESGKVKKRITSEFVNDLLGTTLFDPDENETEELIGLARGLAWTLHGGTVLPVEVSLAKGKGALELTGQLGDVMKESAKAAVFYVRSNALELGVPVDFHSKFDLHIHLPAGATPKDGPSAGITLLTALVSALAKKPVCKEVAMTGEITLRGNVLPIGGLKEKVLAALRAGITTVIIPHANIKDLDEVPLEQRQKLDIYGVKHVREVLEIALVGGIGSSKGKGKSKGKRKLPTLLVEA